MKLNALSRRQLLLIAVLGLLGLLVLDHLIFSPVLNGWRARQDRIAELRGWLAEGDNLLDQETRWLRRREEMMERLLPENRSVAENQLLGLVNDWARESGLKVTSLRPLWKETETREPLLELQVAGTCGIQSLTRFLYAVETARTAVAIEQLDLSAQGQDGRELGMTLRLSGLCQGGAVISRRKR